MKRLYTLGMLGSLSLVAMEEGATKDQFAHFASSNTYRGVPITPETIRGMAGDMPALQHDFIQAWLRMKPEVAAAMAGAEVFGGDNPILGQDAAGRLAYYEVIQKRLKDAGFESLSKSSNIVLIIGDLVLKASTLPNRRENANAFLGNPYGTRQLSPEQLQRFNDEQGGNTYQGISRVAIALRGQEACEIFGLDRIAFPKKYLVHIPGRPDEVSDTNYLIVQEKVNNVVAVLCDYPVAALDPEIIRQLAMVVGYTGLWNLVGSDGNIFVVKDPDTGKLSLVVYDNELPNNRSPQGFLTITLGNIGNGFESLENEIINGSATKLRKALDRADISPEQREFLTSLVNERAEHALRIAREIHKKISENFKR